MLLVTACQDKPAPRPNRAIQAVSLINPNAKCYSIEVGTVDTAYCALNGEVSWCEAGSVTPVKCALVARQQAEQPEPTRVPAPAPAKAPEGAR